MNIFNTLKIFACWFTARFNRKRLICPSCGGEPSGVMDRRFLVLTLTRCSSCGLLFRQPTDEPSSTKLYYQGEYRDPSITEIPNTAELDELIKNSFDQKFNRAAQVKLVRHLTGPGKFLVLDFGCSWGYASWQFRAAGFDVHGFEIGKERAEHAADWLDIPVFSDQAEIQGQYDVIYSSHVFEHVPELQTLLDKLKTALKPGGFFVAITPNGGTEARGRNSKIWHKLWGRRHPIFIDGEYWFSAFRDWEKLAFSRSPFSGDSTIPYKKISLQALQASAQLDLSGDELVFIAKKRAN